MSVGKGAFSTSLKTALELAKLLCAIMTTWAFEIFKCCPHLSVGRLSYGPLLLRTQEHLVRCESVLSIGIPSGGVMVV